MAVTKIHPIKSTLKAALDYIMDSNKTDERILISSLNCNPITAHLEFEQTKIECNSKAKVLARHLIQAFAPGETTPEEAHKIGIELCEKVLQGKYEYVITTHVDKGHIHNHILFNNVSFETGKAYQSNKKTYHQIRNHSDDLCRKYQLLVIDEDYVKFKEKYKTNGKSYKEYIEFNKGKSWKHKLQISIDHAINKANSYENFLKLMEEYGYEIKLGKYLSFRHKKQGEKGRFIRARETTLGKDYTKEKIKERIENKVNENYKNSEVHYAKKSYKKFDNIIDIESNEKVKSSKAYEIWAKKHNMNTMADTLNQLRKYGLTSNIDLENKLQQEAINRQKTLNEIKNIEKDLNEIYTAIEALNTLQINKSIYEIYKSNSKDKEFYAEYRTQIITYEKSLTTLDKTKYKNLSIKELSNIYDEYKSKKDILMVEYSNKNILIYELTQLRKNTDKYINNELI
ncbi:relaxase/mobilization nuclease domain-containing protein [Peptoniphilus gorbachii]|uniref:Relaxase/Mobilisation nuclease domain protein n=1 Tax=Peptoniphilus gorbachii TaxID=411567 RepID=A0A6N2ZLG2_9FIRM